MRYSLIFSVMAFCTLDVYLAGVGRLLPARSFLALGAQLPLREEKVGSRHVVVLIPEHTVQHVKTPRRSAYHHTHLEFRTNWTA